MSDDAETAILAGGCYWIMQPLGSHPEREATPTRVGWTGGEGENPTEEILVAMPRWSRSSSIRSGSPPPGTSSSTSSRSTDPT